MEALILPFESAWNWGYSTVQNPYTILYSMFRWFSLVFIMFYTFPMVFHGFFNLPPNPQQKTKRGPVARARWMEGGAISMPRMMSRISLCVSDATFTLFFLPRWPWPVCQPVGPVSLRQLLDGHRLVMTTLVFGEFSCLINHTWAQKKLEPPKPANYPTKTTLYNLRIRPYPLQNYLQNRGPAAVVRQDQILQLHLDVNPLIVRQAGPNVVRLRHLRDELRGAYAEPMQERQSCRQAMR